VSVSEEARWVSFDLLKGEPGAGVSTVCQDTSGEWACQTADGATNHGWVVADWKGVWESNARGTRGTLDGLMDVSRRFGKRLVVSSHACEGDVLIILSASVPFSIWITCTYVAEDLQVAVDTVVVVSYGSRLSRCSDSTIDDLIRGSNYCIC
jgi:hypothetical protein